MKNNNIFDYFRKKYIKYKTKNLALAIRCTAVGYIQNETNTYKLVIKPKKYQIVTKCNDNQKIKYFTKKFGYRKTNYGKAPNFAGAPSYIQPKHTFYKCPTSDNEILPAVPFVDTKCLMKKDQHQYDFILGSPAFLNIVFDKKLILADTISLENLISLEDYINKELLEANTVSEEELIK